MSKCGRIAALTVLFVFANARIATAAGRPDPLSVHPSDRVRESLSNGSRVVLSGQRHHLARPEWAIGKLAPDQRLEHMVLVLRPDAEQERALDQLIEAQQDPASPLYHQWLTPEAFGERFGISERDLNLVTSWLQQEGLTIEEIPASRRAIVFSGSVARVESAFRTSMHRYSVNGEVHYANASDPEIPAALAAVVHGAVALHDFQSKASLASSGYTLANGVHMMAPLDWAKIYDVDRLYSVGLDGAGQSIAVIGRVDIDPQDIRTFRAQTGLPPSEPQIIINGEDPGTPWCDDEAESVLDVEWAGALAKNAAIKFVTSKSGATDGINLSAQYAVTHNVAPIITVSYIQCEAQLGPAGNAFWNSLWAQAAAQGISVFVASGDTGAAGCDSLNSKTATEGRGVNGICSSPYATCVGGSEFDPLAQNTYWSATNGPGMSSVLGYIPEVAWNESAWSGNIAASGGGVSSVYPKPGWQTAPGVPADGQLFYVTGTSAAAPSLASVTALLLQDTHARLGNLNPTLYSLGARQFAGGGAAVFHDITAGNNTVPGVTGYAAGLGYDQVTGLGSIDAFLFVNHWRDGIAPPAARIAPPALPRRDRR
jgi:subtilase family serine protease